MKLSQFGFAMLVMIYLAPLLAIDIETNTVSTGMESDVAFYKTLFDGLLLAFAVYQGFFGGATASLADAQRRKADHRDTAVADFSNIGAIEYIYCLVLSAYACANFFMLHSVNKSSTGLMSMGTLIWSFLSLAVCALAAIQFYHLKSGQIVQLKNRMIQN
jgi:hypothetical protein